MHQFIVLFFRYVTYQWRIYIVKFWTRAPPPPRGVQILSISCSFWENLAKSYVGAPPGELAPPPRGNPGSATAYIILRSVADPGFSSRGVPIPKVSVLTYYFCNFLPKTAWKSKNLDPGGGGAILAHPLGSATVDIQGSILYMFPYLDQTFFLCLILDLLLFYFVV